MRRQAYQPSMSDIGPGKQNSHLIGIVDDISQLGSNSQGNKPLENMAHQTFLRRELRRQENRRPGQENEHQEIKPAVAQPVLNFNYSSIQSQSTSEPDSSSDQFFMGQDASTKLSTMNSLNPKKIQEDPPQEIKSNQETARQAVELQKVEPQKVERQKVEKVDPQEVATKPQEIKSDRYTRDQGEYTAQTHIIPDQDPTYLSVKAKRREYLPFEIKSEQEEIEPQEVQPQADVPIQFLLGRQALASVESFFPSFRFPKYHTDNEELNNGKPWVKRKRNGPFAFLKGALARQVKTEELSQDDVIIAVMGPTGSGKSTFIKLATGFDTIVGHTLESCTSEINIVKLSVPELADGDIVFVDTPGFDDTHKSDADILKIVADWLKTTYEKQILLSGLLYFHRISDNRMAGTPLKNLRMFEELCGKNAFHNVILTTTMWDEVDEETGRLREQELKSKYWQSMLARNSTTSRFMGTRESALRLIEPLIEAANAKSSLLLQQEMVDMRFKLPATSAGQRLFSEMEDLVKKRQELLGQIRNAMKCSNEDKASLPALQEEHQKLKMQLDMTISDMRKLKLPLGKRLSRMTRKWFSFKFSF